MFSIATFFFILASGAVKSDDTSNYYVVQMPDDDVLKETPHKSLQVFWNVPTIQCKSKRIPFEKLQDRYGIIQNRLDNFRGNKVAIMYDPGYFPAIFKNTSTGELVLRNGGVPQEGDLELHMKQFRKDVEHQIEDPDFDGVGIIDFESWRPIFRQNFGTLEPYQKLSCDIEKKKHWWWPNEWIKADATKHFEEAARRFMQNTISIAKQLRPRARWGYYGFPYCFNHAPSVAKCAKLMAGENDRLYWLWAESTALFPSIYSSASLTTPQLSAFVKARVREAARLARSSTPILPYWWFRYRDSGYFTQDDVSMAVQTLNRSSASGFVIWGSSADVNTPDKCHHLLKYIESVIGPSVATYTQSVSKVEDLNSTEAYTEDGNFLVATTSDLYGAEHVTEHLSSTVENETYIDGDKDEVKMIKKQYYNTRSNGDVSILTTTAKIGVYASEVTIHSTITVDITTNSPIIEILSTNNYKDTTTSGPTANKAYTKELITVKGDSTTLKSDSTTKSSTFAPQEYEDTYITSVEDDDIVFNEEDFFDTSYLYDRKENIDISTVQPITDFTTINTDTNIKTTQEAGDTASGFSSTTTESHNIGNSTVESLIEGEIATVFFEERTNKTSTTVIDVNDSKIESLNTYAGSVMESVTEQIAPKFTTVHESIKTTTSQKDYTTPRSLEKEAESSRTTTIKGKIKMRHDWKRTLFSDNDEQMNENETFEDNETVLRGDARAMGLTSRVNKVFV